MTSEDQKTAPKAQAFSASDVVAKLSRKLGAGEELTPVELLSYMADYGRRLPGISVNCFTRYRNDQGDDTYGWALKPLLELKAGRVLDVGCGVGHALSLFPSSFSVSGIDISKEDLLRAKRALRERGVVLERSPAQSLPFGNGAFDAVLCHMALMLFNPIEPALREVGRVLASEGRFVALFPSTWTPVPAFTSEFNSIVAARAKAAFPGYPTLGIGSDRLKSKDAIAKLIEDTIESSQVSLEDSVFEARLPVDEAVTIVSQLYWCDLMPAKEAQATQEAFRSHFEGLKQSDGLTIMSRPFCRLTVTKA
jgi:SAM-dependent methyltransferase